MSASAPGDADEFGGRLPPKDPLFKTITGDDWKRSLAISRAQPNTTAEQIRAKIAAVTSAKPAGALHGVVLIAGGSGSGKSTVAAGLAKQLGWLQLSLDDYYQAGRKAYVETASGKVRTFERPELYDGRRLAADVNQKIQGIVVEGFCLLTYPEIEALAGLRYYLDVPFEICLARRRARQPQRPSDRSFEIVGEHEMNEIVIPQRALTGVRVLDGMRPSAELVTEIASDVLARSKASHLA